MTSTSSELGNLKESDSIMSSDKNEADTTTIVTVLPSDEDFHCELVEDESYLMVSPTAQQVKRKENSTSCTETNSPATNTAVRTISREFARINRRPLPGISVKLADDSNLFEWEVLMEGPSDSPFAGGTFRLRLAFPSDYPTSPPKVWFFTEMFHPNVFAEDGRVCVDVLQNAEKWRANYGIETVLAAVQILLAEPNILSPAHPEAGDLYQTDLEEYSRRVKRIVLRSETHRKLSLEEKQLNFNTVKRTNQLACVVM